MQIQIRRREDIKRQVCMDVNKADGLFFCHKRPGDKQVRAVAPLNMKLSDLRKIVEIAEGEIAFIQSRMRDRMQDQESGLFKARKK